MVSTLSAKRRGRKPAAARYADPRELTEHYAHFFETLRAGSGALYKAALHLRYRVLCDERQMLAAADYPEQMESDGFDAQSQHAVLCYRPDNRLIGTARLILPRAGTMPPGFALCPIMAQEAPMEKSGEVSRFLVSKEFRRRWNDGDFGAVSPWLDGDNQRHIPHTSLGLMRALLMMAREAGLTHVTALMEPAMMRMLEGLGLYFAPMGAMVDCHGLRQPCYAKIDGLLRRLKQERPEIWHFMTDGGRQG